MCLRRLTILPHIPPIIIDMLKLPQRFDDKQVLPRPGNNQLRALMQAVIQHLERLQHVAPVLALVVQALVEHVHDFVELRRAVTLSERRSSEIANRVALRIVCHLRDLLHLGPGWTPWVVAGRCNGLVSSDRGRLEVSLSHTIANLDLHRRISLRDILHAPHNL